MALFNRRTNKNDVLPEEVRDYYQAERRERTGRAWLLALATLLVTFLIAAGLFFGGRWLYRTIFDRNDNKATNTTSQVEEGNKQDDEHTSSTNTGNTESDGDDESSEGDEHDSTQNGSATTGSQGTSGSSTGNGSNGGSTAGASTTTPNTGPDELVNTGPGDEL